MNIEKYLVALLSEYSDPKLMIKEAEYNKKRMKDLVKAYDDANKAYLKYKQDFELETKRLAN